jgi:hypothetical protein
MELAFSARTFAILLLLSYPGLVAAQVSPTFVPQLSGRNDDGNVIKGPLGKPCLDIEAAARAQLTNPNMFDHVVSIKNECNRLISVKLCYANSDHCRQLIMHPYKRIDTILGSMQGVTVFKYSVTQKLS